MSGKQNNSLEKISRGRPVQLVPCKVITKIIWSEDSETYMQDSWTLAKDRNHVVSLSTCYSVYPPSWQSQTMLLSHLQFLCSSLLYLFCAFTLHFETDSVYPLLRYLQKTVRFLVHFLFLCWAENFPQPFHFHPVFRPPAIPVGFCCTHCSISIFLFLCWVASIPHIYLYDCQIEERDHFSGLSAHKSLLKISGCDWPPILQGRISVGRCWKKRKSTHKVENLRG